MTGRFEGLTKISGQPAARILAMANVKLDTKLDAPANAPVATVLDELQEKQAHLDMLRLLAVSLPVRERIWWACLAGRDIVEASGPSPTLEAAETWVFKPSDSTRQEAMTALDIAELDDDAQLCATAVAYSDDTLGPGELSKYPAPPGASQMAAFGVNMKALALHGDEMEMFADRLIDRAVDIARGGNGLPNDFEAKGEE
ncbi:DUF6931 family protein [Algicella marina]|uniref:Uncharacterized protein n=1 Tax=Algicella marina TaxID=2683284 RepID=A0A6P1T461_9RHOB|nr:hypothetical protein [Algicella marina]QHQ36545.1 hypothetical protein GO499_15880 [Algicella marina]